MIFIDFYLSYNNKEDELRLPVTPSSFSITTPTSGEVINIQNIGDIALIGKLGLASISITSFFPAQEYHFCKYKDFPTPNECIELIKKWQNSQKPIRLIITETDINYAMVINSFSYGLSSGKDVDFTLELSEYRFLNISTTETQTTERGTEIVTTETERESKEVTSTTYIVQSGDTLWEIAKKLTGNPNNYKAIADANSIKDPTKIYVGDKIII